MRPCTHPQMEKLSNRIRIFAESGNVDVLCAGCLEWFNPRLERK